MRIVNEKCKINKSNYEEFLKYYHSFHDSYITNINYDIYNEKIEMFIDVCWSGKPVLKDDNTYETNKIKMKINFNKVDEYFCSEIFSWDYIDKAVIRYVLSDDKEMISFSSDDVDPIIKIVCEEIEYEEIGGLDESTIKISNYRV